ncbi:efflux RND transporter periplasmic adaptor subunit [Telmatobacter bradus]|uniref:efflux RND transporter periplasmic adaptor subunit n=1 Tax=Telmatobacter bradus TaxID=474953 RepID=UPI003B4374A9
MEETKTQEQRRKKIGQWIVAGLLIAASVVVVTVAIRSGWFSGAIQTNSSAAKTTSSSGPKILYWYDPMHPAYKSNKPGIAPDCGMTLVPKYAEESKADTMPAGTVTLSGNQQTLAGVQTVAVRRAPLVREIHTSAEIVADETRISHVHLKTSGFIDQVFVDALGQLVHKGDKLFTLYSPDLVAAEEEYLIARRGNATLGTASIREVREGAASLLASSRQKLKLLDVTDQQIARLDATGEVTRDLTFYAPVSGFVTDRKAFPQASATPDTELYTLSNLSSVWANADIYEYELPYVHLGQKMTLTLSYFPGKTYTAKIFYIDPSVDPQTRTVKVRVQLPNPGFKLKPQMFADATLHVDYGKPLLVPQEAVLDSGNTQQVFVVHPGGAFEPRHVTIGPVVDGQTVILAGLKEGEVVVSSGNFLLDSESRMKSSAGGAQ